MNLFPSTIEKHFYAYKKAAKEGWGKGFVGCKHTKIYPILDI
jgi:hypothetical protein